MGAAPFIVEALKLSHVLVLDAPAALKVRRSSAVEAAANPAASLVAASHEQPRALSSPSMRALSSPSMRAH